MDAKKIGMFIMESRKAQNMTQSQLAEKLRVTDKAISKWERGVGLPDVTMIEPLADALGVSIVELMKGEHIESEHMEEADIKKAFLNLIEIIKQKKYIKRWQMFAGVVVGLVVAVIGISHMKKEHYFEIWQSGIHAMMNYPEEFDTHIRGVIGEWSVGINLADLESNKGKVVFEENGYSIVVDEVYQHLDNYCVGFRAYGKSDLNHGAIFSALSWESYGNCETSSHWGSKIKVTGSGIEYDTNVRGWGGHPKNGARFDIYVYPSAAQNIEFPDGKTDYVVVTFETLVYQEWNRVLYRMW